MKPGDFSKYAAGVRELYEANRGVARLGRMAPQDRPFAMAGATNRLRDAMAGSHGISPGDAQRLDRAFQEAISGPGLGGKGYSPPTGGMSGMVLGGMSERGLGGKRIPVNPRKKELVESILARNAALPAQSVEIPNKGIPSILESMGLIERGPSRELLPAAEKRLVDKLRISAAIEGMEVPDFMGSWLKRAPVVPTRRGIGVAAAGAAGAGLGVAALARKLMGGAAPVAAEAAAPTMSSLLRANPYLAAGLGAGALGLGAYGLSGS